jgi:hypothetical protein
MTKGKRRYLVALVMRRGVGLWNADFRWAQKRSSEVTRRFADGNGAAWWHRVKYTVPLKPLRGQKR